MKNLQLRIITAIALLIPAAPGWGIAADQADSHYRLDVQTEFRSSTAASVADALEQKFGISMNVVPRGDSYHLTPAKSLNKTEAASMNRELTAISLEGVSGISIRNHDGPDKLPGIFQESHYSIPAIKVNGSVEIDGILKEDVWKEAAMIQGLVQFFPSDREPETEKTRIYVFYDDEALYVGVICFDRSPEGIIAYETRRDTELDNDDYIAIKLDTFHDRRNHYLFATNPLGAKLDGLTYNNKDYSSQWDGVWYTKSSRGPEGWMTEMKIPFQSLRFNNRDGETWGINFARHVRRKLEINYWAPIPRALVDFDGEKRTDLFGTLTNLNLAGAVKNVEIKPFVVGGESKTYVSNQTIDTREIGGDLRYAFSSNNKLELSYNMDFAQVESDQEIINFTRFPLQFPEKREFFLETEGDFSVAPSQVYTIFYSRRIGLEEGRQVPIVGAAKYSMTHEGYTGGLLHVVTEEENVSFDPNSLSMIPRSHYSAARLRKNIGETTNMGLLFLNKQQTNYYNRTLEFDGIIFPRKNIRAQWSIAKTFTKGVPEGDDYGVVGRIDYARGNYTTGFRYFDMGANYRLDMGYMKRLVYKSYFSSHNYTHWFKNSIFRSLAHGVSAFYLTTRQNDVRYDFYRYRTFLTFASGDVLFTSIFLEGDRLPGDVNISKLFIRRGKYWNQEYTFGLRLDKSRILSGTATATDEKYYGGDRNKMAFTGSVRARRWLRIDIDYERNKVTLANQELSANVLSNRWSFSMTPKLFLRNYIQWNDVEKRLSGQFLFHYLYRPDSDIFVMINQTRDSDHPWDIQRDRTLMVKWTYLFQI